MEEANASITTDRPAEPRRELALARRETLELKMRDAVYQDGEAVQRRDVQARLRQGSGMDQPASPGAFLNFARDVTCEAVDTAPSTCASRAGTRQR